MAQIPPPEGDTDAPARALIFDSEFDQYRGVIAYVRVVDGELKKGDAIVAMQTGTQAEIDDIGFFGPAHDTGGLAQGGRGGLRDHRHQGRVAAARGRHAHHRAPSPPRSPLPGYREVKPMVFCGLFPVETDRFSDLRDALEKLALNDAALSYEPETSQALGFGFRCGFLGPAAHGHRARAPRARVRPRAAGHHAQRGVRGDAHQRRGGGGALARPTCPSECAIEEIREPYIRATILCPKESVGAVMELCQERRGTHVDMSFLSEQRVQLRYDLPLAEIVLDFFDQLKSRTKGYASLDYELTGMRPSELVKLDILLAGDQVDALSMVVHKDKAYDAGRGLAERLRKQIPRQQFEVAIQAAIGAKIIARESVKPMRKDVIAKCYGGDITRKKKLLEKQKEGKKRMKQVGRIEVPQEAFLSVLQIGDGS